jgi:hypothetical protein
MHPDEFLSFALGGARVGVLKPLSAVLPARSRTVDDAFLVEIDGTRRVAHMEYVRRHQGQDELGLDVAEAQVRLFRREGVLVLSFAWDLYGKPGGPLLRDQELSFGIGSKCSYRMVNLRGQRVEDLLLSGPAGLWPLAPLFEGGASEGAIQKTAAAIGGLGLPPSTEADYLAVLYFIAEREGLPLQMLARYIPRRKMMESQLYKEIFQEGEDRGKAEGKAESLLRFFLRRFDYINEALSRRVLLETRTELLDLWFDEAVMLPDASKLPALIERILRTPAPASEPTP